MRYFGAYSSKARTYRKKQSFNLQSFRTHPTSAPNEQPELSSKKRASLRKNWARLIKRVYLVDPLKCDCGGTFVVIAFITHHKVITKILEHLEKKKTKADSRAPPES